MATDSVLDIDTKLPNYHLNAAFFVLQLTEI